MQENISNNIQTIIDVRKTLLHKVPSFSEFYQVFFPLIPKENFIEFEKNKDFQNFNDLILSFAKDCSISNINSLSIDEYLKTAGYKVKLLEEFIKNYEFELNIQLFLPYKKQYKRLFYLSVFEKNYPRIFNKIIAYTKDEIIKNIKSSNNNKMIFISHNLDVFFKLIRQNDIKIYFCNHFLSVLKKQNHENILKIKSEVLKPDFEINILSQIPSVLKFLNDQEKSSEKIINVGYFLMSKKSEEFSEKKILLSNFPIKLIPIDPRYELENKNYDVILHKITDILKFYGQYASLAVSAKQNLINFYNKYKNEIIFVDPLDNLDVVYSRISFQNIFEKIFNSENFISLLEKTKNKLKIKVPKIIEITEEDKKNIDLIKIKIEKNKMTPPFIVKTVEALGDLKSHFMAVALDLDGIEIIEKHEIFKY